MALPLAPTDLDRVCTRPECEVPRGGNCFDGIAVENCSFHRAAIEARQATETEAESGAGLTEGENVVSRGPLSRVAVPSEPADAFDAEIWASLEIKPPPAPETDWLPQPSGRAMAPGEVERVAGTGVPVVVVLAAMPNSGKTSLFASIMNLFQAGPIEDISFAGSETLVGFEERTVLARVASGRDTPDVLRTPTGEAAYLHLRVARNNKELTICLADVSGESFRQLSQRKAEQALHPMLARADHVALMIDGAELSSSAAGGAATEAGLLLRSLLENKLLGRHTRLYLLITKFDLLVQNLGLDDAIALASKVFARLEARVESLSPWLLPITTHCITAWGWSPEAAALDPLRQLFAEWAVPSSIPATLPAPQEEQEVLASAFDRFLPRGDTVKGRIGQWTIRGADGPNE